MNFASKGMVGFVLGACCATGSATNLVANPDFDTDILG